MVLTCMDGAAMIIVTGILIGLPVTTWPAVVLVAETVTVVLYVLLATPVGFSTTLKGACTPTARLEPDAGESEIHAGVPLAKVAVQLSGLPPVLLISMGDDVVPGTLMVILEGATTKTGGPGGLSTNLTITASVPAEELKVSVPV